MKILVVEDEQDLNRTICDFLKSQSHVCESARDFDEAMMKIGVYEYDVVLLDLMLPKGEGLELLKVLKQQSSTSGVIIISAKDSLEDKLKGLDIGADDYLAKPFHLSELNARIKSLTRRLKFEGSNQIFAGEISIDPEARTVRVHQNEVLLNRKEYDLLLFFVTNQNRVIKKTSLAEHVWGDYIDQVDSLDFIYSQLKNLRKKFNQAGYDLNIQSVYGIGYKFIPN